MPRPLTSAGHQERLLLEALAVDPRDPAIPFAAADEAEEREQKNIADTVRGVEALRKRGFPVVRPQLLSLLRGLLPVEAEAANIAASIRALLALPTGQIKQGEIAALECSISATLDQLQGNGETSALLDAEGNLDEERLKEQYHLQIVLLASLDLLEQRDKELGITGIDDHFHPLPSLETVRQRLKTPELRRKMKQGFDALLVVPFALPLQRLIEAWRRCLRRNQHLVEPSLRGSQSLLLLHPSYEYEELLDRTTDFVYYPTSLSRSHGGLTKQQRLEEGHAWDILLVEGNLINLPQAGEGNLIADRQQIEMGQTPREYLASLSESEEGWTIETYIIRFAHVLESQGQALDEKDNSYLIGSFFLLGNSTPLAHGNLLSANVPQGVLDLVDLDDDDDRDACARTAVRVL